MPITFTTHHARGYFIAKYTGEITDVELLRAYQEYFQGEEWTPGLNELSDISEANLSKVSSEGLRSLAAYARYIFNTHDVGTIKTAEYAPKDGIYGLARMYAAMTFESKEKVHVFRDLAEATRWVEK